MMNSSTLLDRPTRPRERELTGGRVLLAEDDPEMRSLLASALRNESYDVIEVADGKELLDRLSESIILGNVIDFIVTDVRMPRLTGLQALGLLKGALLETPVIVITAFGDPSTHMDARLLGAVAVMDKPFDIDDLLEVIRKLRTEPMKGGP